MAHIDSDDKYFRCGCGCGACEAGCPTRAITVDLDEELMGIFRRLHIVKG